jgi:hypothetical protein
MNLTETTAFTDRDGIVDAVTRVVEGIDFGNEDLLRSAFTEDAVFDLGGIHHSIHSFEPYVGRDEVVRTLMETVGTGMDTFHALSDIRVRVRDHDHVWLVRRNRVTSPWSVGNPAAAAISAGG